MGLDISAGAEVITTAFTFFATVGCIARTGARPALVDIDPQTYNLDPAAIEAAITDRTKAILPVHLYGQMAQMDAIMEIADRHHLPVIEDAAQSITSTYQGRKAGSFGRAGCFSFFPSKNLGGVGDGGMIVTNDQAYHQRLMALRNHGMEPKYYHDYIGANFRLDPIQAAALLVKLPHLNDWSAGRRRNAAHYNQRFAGTDIVTPHIDPDCVTIYNQYVIRVPRRDELFAHLKEKQIGCDIYYPVPMHLQKCFAYLGYGPGRFPQAEQAARAVIALPVYAEMTPAMIDYVADTILNFLA